MHTTKVVEYVDIAAPRQEVWDIVMNLERRLQLSPLWGAAVISEMSPDYPSAGSRYHVRLVQGDQAEYDTLITGCEPLRRFAYQLTVDRKTEVLWTFQEVTQGTRVIYEEDFQVEEGDEEEAFAQSVRKVVQQWLGNLKRYAELRESRLQRLVKYFLDRFYLRLRNEQRRVIQTILFLQAVGFISFLMAAIALGIASLV